MTAFRCFFGTFSKLAIATVLALIGLGAVISGFTILPIFGILLAVPIFYLAWFFIRTPLNRQCEIEV